MTQRESRSFRTALVLLLFGPVVGTAHFLVVYLLAEVACAASWLRSDVLGVGALSLLTVVLTVAAAAATGSMAAAARRSPNGDHRDLTFAGSLLGVLFTVEILLVGIPPAFLEPC